MKNFLDFGIIVDESGDAFHSISEIDSYIPNDHRFLLDFINKKNEVKLNIILMRIKASYKNKLIDRDSLISEIKSIHPYFRLRGHAEAYFNRTLAGAIFSDNKDVPSSDIQDVFERSMCTLPGMETDINCWLTATTESFDDVVNCYKDLRLCTALIFDDSKPKLASLPIPSRCALYNVVSCREGSTFDIQNVMLEIPVRYEYYPKLSSSLSATVTFDDDMCDYCNDIYSITPESKDISDRVYELVDRMFSDCHDDSRMSYIIKSFSSLMQLETYLMFQSGTRLNKCKSCGRMFAIEDDGQVFCKFNDETGENCFEKGKKDELRAQFRTQISKYYRRSYKKMYERISYGRITKAEFDEWKASTVLKKESILKGETPYSLEDGNPFD